MKSDSKTKKYIDILVLSDNKPGHLNQSLGIIRRLPDRTAQVISIQYKTQFHRWIIYLCCLCNRASWNILRWALIDESFVELVTFKPKCIISTGSSVAPINFLLGRIYPAKTVVSMRSGVLNQGKVFDLAILPYHDKLKIIQNAMYVLGTPNSVTESFLKKHGEELAPQVRKSEGMKIGVLIGGDSETCFVPVDCVKEVVDGLLQCNDETSLQFLLTTSRRTSSEVERYLQKHITQHASCVYALFASKSAFNPVPGILGLADIILVSEDSYSMVSEAASTGKPVLVIRVERVAGKELKYEKTLQEMEKQGYIQRIRSDQVKPALQEVLIKKVLAVPKLNDSEKAADALNSLLNRTDKENV